MSQFDTKNIAILYAQMIQKTLMSKVILNNVQNEFAGLLQALLYIYFETNGVSWNLINSYRSALLLISNHNILNSSRPRKYIPVTHLIEHIANWNSVSACRFYRIIAKTGKRMKFFQLPKSQ
jgi:hypothetical protein